ncbi:uncharacterized protein MONOS_4276 [Monocercomonoides exilis]|uniref:uncharacterized protein n=1 Tax=Monocercomonoides exilis TaxID=2049356 RepID=UPI00355A9E56|nr:hypothetical protein MONOS_4276 [Monocercomonoides exilis]|eukprot:MONOS_4276.1-p1 / transcript=MONOS_4276.1 / gene=MONOS_4276 / organism=Monocercomonoides_exilis_PA203 / gene_product=unspecified product / transcript_product=unspecified product / location=Mono_scaffold00111:109847-111331(+) / protein_length=476 / sequence_SO=supercontig / SO=protein_coding / is_pseudo=false
MEDNKDKIETPENSSNLTTDTDNDKQLLDSNQTVVQTEVVEGEKKSDEIAANESDEELFEDDNEPKKQLKDPQSSENKEIENLEEIEEESEDEEDDDEEDEDDDAYKPFFDMFGDNKRQRLDDAENEDQKTEDGNQTVTRSARVLKMPTPLELDQMQYEMSLAQQEQSLHSPGLDSSISKLNKMIDSNRLSTSSILPSPSPLSFASSRLSQLDENSIASMFDDETKSVLGLPSSSITSVDSASMPPPLSSRASLGKSKAGPQGSPSLAQMFSKSLSTLSTSFTTLDDSTSHVSLSSPVTHVSVLAPSGSPTASLSSFHTSTQSSVWNLPTTTSRIRPVDSSSFSNSLASMSLSSASLSSFSDAPPTRYSLLMNRTTNKDSIDAQLKDLTTSNESATISKVKKMLFNSAHKPKDLEMPEQNQKKQPSQEQPQSPLPKPSPQPQKTTHTSNATKEKKEEKRKSMKQPTLFEMKTKKA